MFLGRNENSVHENAYNTLFYPIKFIYNNKIDLRTRICPKGS